MPRLPIRTRPEITCRDREAVEESRGLSCSRRDFLAGSGSCAAHLMWMLAATSLGARRLFAAESRGKTVAEEPWGRLEELHDGVWAVISTPLTKDWTTLANGGIIAGRDRVLVVESFARAEGAEWVARMARELTGRPPTDVVLTHYHGDHTNGVAGFERGGPAPRFWATPTTLDLLRRTPAGGNDGRDDAAGRAAIFAGATALAEDGSTEIDLGGRRVRLHPRAGHTASDVTVELEDPSVVFYGDLLWHRMFPNFRDTTPSVFAHSIRAAMRQRETVYVPGHGPLAATEDIERLLAVLAEIEGAARHAFDREITAVEAAASFRLPESLGGWTLFDDSYYAVAIGAWHKELAAGGGERTPHPHPVGQDEADQPPMDS